MRFIELFLESYLLLNDVNYGGALVPCELANNLDFDLSEVVGEHPWHLGIELEEAVEDPPVVESFEFN